jgi:hypothetical protein
MLATRSLDQDNIVILLHNYIDPEIFRSCLSENIGTLNKAERKILMNLIKSGKLKKIMNKEIEINKRVSPYKRLRSLLKKALELNDLAQSYKAIERSVNLEIKNLKAGENYSYQKYVIDSSCQGLYEFSPREEKDINGAGVYKESVRIAPYSVQMIILRRMPAMKPPVEEVVKTTNTTAAPEIPANVTAQQ